MSKNPPLDLNSAKDTISNALIREALSVAASRGLNIVNIANRASISAELLTSAKARIPVTQCAQLWVELAESMNDEFLGMDSHPMRRGSYKLLAKLAFEADTLEQAIREILKFLSLVLDDIHGELVQNGSKAYLILHDRDQPKRMFTYSTFLMLVHSLMCWLSDQRIAFLKMSFKCHQPVEIQDYRIRFCENIQFHATQNCIEFDAHYLKHKIKKDKQALNDFLRHTPYNLIVRFKNENSLSLQIRRQLLLQPPSEWAELKDIAQQLNMSTATIQRRLKQEGVSYQQLKNDIRCDIAIERLSKTNDSIQSISDDLNFHDPSAFHRAFKKWSGVSPGSYRKSAPNKQNRLLHLG
ncbi:AraC family transcriptional regulator [Acinetobacter haemolyticus]|uniref:AraC family transcriptional regulator n=1 Tax=Acinetobacter haemolyticus TaxID=29430 RepID=UPI000C2B93F2|nr:AraC family transcriptional regulator [Acinetobacter haemolyticus]ATZ67078.1 AraC family transcriptional regulator [Acinetobacter haemolyticus]NAS00332.1 helix-turn-helix domain-containing protein [Acinetobacter haemolyticus]